MRSFHTNDVTPDLSPSEVLWDVTGADKSTARCYDISTGQRNHGEPVPERTKAAPNQLVLM